MRRCEKSIKKPTKVIISLNLKLYCT